MTDVFSPRKRSSIMRAVRSRGTALEKEVSKYLRRLSIAHRLQADDLPGSPDIVIDVSSVAVFVHGCFWHGHPGCARAALPATRRQFWAAKISTNRRRDAAAVRRLRRMGYSVLTVWGCQLKRPDLVGSRLAAAVRRRG